MQVQNFTNYMDSVYEDREELIKQETTVSKLASDFKEALNNGARVYATLCERDTLKRVQGDEFKRLLESSQFIGSDDNWDPSDPNAEFLPMMMGPFYRQLYQFDYLDMQRKAWYAWNHDPVAHQIINLTLYFVLGSGVQFDCTDAQLQNDFKAWWDSQNMNKRLNDACKELSIYGEIMWRKTIDPFTGQLRIRLIDPSTIWEVVTAPTDIETVFFYHQQYATQYQIMSKNIPVSEYIINQIPAHEVLHVKVNAVSNEKRGRSDLFPIFGLLKQLRDYMKARVVRGILQTSMVWKNNIS